MLHRETFRSRIQNFKEFEVERTTKTERGLTVEQRQQDSERTYKGGKKEENLDKEEEEMKY